MNLLTVVPMYFMDVDSFAKMRFCTFQRYFSFQNMSPLFSPTFGQHLIFHSCLSPHIQMDHHAILFFLSYFHFFVLLYDLCWRKSGEIHGMGRKRWHLDLNQLICFKLGLWSCQLWYLCPTWSRSLLAKWILFIAWTSFISKFDPSYLLPPLGNTWFSAPVFPPISNRITMQTPS